MRSFFEVSSPADLHAGDTAAAFEHVMQVVHAALDHAFRDFVPLVFERIEQPVTGYATYNGSQLSCEVVRGLNAGIHTDSAERRHVMHRVADEQHAAVAQTLRNNGCERV